MKRRLYAVILSCLLLSWWVVAGANDLPEVEARSQPSWERGTSRNMESRVAALERQLSGDGLQLIDRIEALQQEVQNLRGLVEEQQHTLETLKQQRAERVSSLSKPATNPEPIVGSVNELSETAQVMPPAVASFTQGAEKIATTPGEVERQLYEEAYSYLQSRQYQPALDQLQALMKRFPNGQYAVSAQYWIGEVFLVQGKVDLAENVFQQLVKQYPQHAKTGDALLKLGYVACAKGNYPQAKDIFTQVKSRYPDTPTARLADARLQKMKQDGQL